MIKAGDQHFDQSQSTSLSSGVEQGAGRDPLLLNQKLSSVYISKTLGISFPNTLLLYFFLRREITKQKGIAFSVEKRLFPFLSLQIR